MTWQIQNLFSNKAKLTKMVTFSNDFYFSNVCLLNGYMEMAYTNSLHHTMHILIYQLSNDA